MQRESLTRTGITLRAIVAECCTPSTAESTVGKAGGGCEHPSVKAGAFRWPRACQSGPAASFASLLLSSEATLGGGLKGQIRVPLPTRAALA